MTIAEVLLSDVNTQVSFEAVLTKLEERPFRNKPGVFLRIEFSDSTGTIGGNVFSGVTEIQSKMKVGNHIQCKGTRDEYNGDPQIKPSNLSKIADTAPPGMFVPSYTITEDHTQKFLQYIDNLSSPWNELASAIFQLECQDEPDSIFAQFITAPAAVKHHSNKVGGLLLHTLGVVGNVINSWSPYGTGSYPFLCDVSSKINKDRIIFLALIHDIGKIYEYEWSRSISYRTETKLDHRYQSLWLFDRANIALGNPLDYVESQLVQYSLMSHYGFYGDVEPKSAEDWILFLSDMLDAKMVTCAEDE